MMICFPAGLDKFSFSGLEELNRLDVPECGDGDNGLCTVAVDMTNCGDQASKWQIMALAPSERHALAVAISRSASGSGAALTAVKTRPLQCASDSILDCDRLEVSPFEHATS
jgi:hypothetical protein